MFRNLYSILFLLSFFIHEDLRANFFHGRRYCSHFFYDTGLFQSTIEYIEVKSFYLSNESAMHEYLGGEKMSKPTKFRLYLV